MGHLQKEGYEIEDLPNAKLDPEMYDALLKKFASEKRLKEKAAQVKGYHEELKQNLMAPDMLKMPGAPGSSPALTPEQLKNKLAKKKSGDEAPEKEAEAPTTEQPAAETSEPAEQPETIETPKAKDTDQAKDDSAEKQSPQADSEAETGDGGEEGPGLKVVGKIDLDAPKKAKAGRKDDKAAKVNKSAEEAEKPAKAEKKADKKADKQTAKKAESKAEKAAAKADEAQKPQAKKQSKVSKPTLFDQLTGKDKEDAAKAEQEATEKAEAEKQAEAAKAESDDKADEKTAEQPAAAEGKEKPEDKEEHKLKGLTVKGKIDLGDLESRTRKKGKSVKKDDEEDSSASGRKRRRRRRKATPVSADEGGSDSRGKGKGKPDDKKMRKTLSNMQGGGGRRRQKLRREKRDRRAQEREQAFEEQLAQESVLQVTEFLTANELANLMNINVNEVIAKSFELGYMVSINQRLDKEVIELIADEFDFEVEFQSATETWAVEIEDDAEEDLQGREPIVTVMGHVDHGKTSLLDHIRSENVIAGEAGGITQHIGAYKVELPDDGRKIAFLDTPGHEAFTAMRARGAQVTDVAIIVIAADDAVMPQTKEAINHAQAADVPMVFAINKIDKPGANSNKIYEQLAEMGLLVEDWGGEIQSQEISAKTGQGVDELLEKVLIQSELLELKANPDRAANGTVIEAELDKGRGVVATIMVQNGTLKIGDVILANMYFGRIKAMKNERGEDVETAGPSTPVQILGLNGVPTAGDHFNVMPSDKDARDIASKREQLLREQKIRTSDTRMSLDQLAARNRSQYEVQDLNIVVKGDVDGSVEALADSLIKLTNEEVNVNVIMKGVGGISESDVLLASASDAIIIGFQVRPTVNARKLIAQEKIDLRSYSVIYDAINDVRDAIEGMLQPELKEEVTASLEVRETFKISKVGMIAGCKVVEGKINRNDPIRLIREGVVIYEGSIDQLKRFKDNVTEVQEGFECGLSIENYNDLKVGDVVESYKQIEVQRKLDSLQSQQH